MALLDHGVRAYFNVAGGLPATARQAREWEADPEERPDRLPMFDGYAIGDRLTPSSLDLVLSAYSPLAAANQAWEVYNADERANGKSERSVSVGDLLRVEAEGRTTWFAVERSGFRIVPVPSIDAYVAP